MQAPAADVGFNLRRLMARHGMTLDELVEASRLDHRTITAILQGEKRPHARTLHKLAAGLGVDCDELFRDRSLLNRRAFDEATNPLVREVVHDHPHWFRGWSTAHFDQLVSQFGAGGPLTREGVEAAVERINRQREVQRKVAVLMETSEAELVAELVEALYRRVAVAKR